MPDFVRRFELKLKVWKSVLFQIQCGGEERCQQTYRYSIIYKPDYMILHVV